MNLRRLFLLFILFTGAASPLLRAADAKPVFLYSRYFNAKGEKRYLPDGTYSDVLKRLGETFQVRVHDQQLNADTLQDVAVVLIANPSDKAVGDNPPPPHCSPADVTELTHFVENGGGLVVMGNQENHNLEVTDCNSLMKQFGLEFVNRYTDAKRLVIPAQAPIIGGLRWAYYTGNLVILSPEHAAKPFPVVKNDLQQKPLGGPRDEAGVLLAGAKPGKGHVLAITDSGWISNDALSGKGIGNVAIKEHDNWDIFLRLAEWAAGMK
jgi:hypothetical protein